ncbi:MAG TPA: hypothetical protein VM050_07375 [Patescibacteria group bacterium]|nr:hypothetical protein [Patescibacteria group bacterium]
MSAEQAVTPDDPQMTQDAAAILWQLGNPGQSGSSQDQDEINSEDLLYGSEDQPLNAEEATILVLHFLNRMKKKVITPRKAVINEEGVFLVDVDLKDATATVHIDSNTREIIEYTIEPRAPEPVQLPIPTRRILIGMAAVLILVVGFMFQNFLVVFGSDYLQMINSDHLIIGATCLILAGIGLWLRRRFF